MTVTEYADNISEASSWGLSSYAQTIHPNSILHCVSLYISLILLQNLF